jgi:hypothetical protein
MGETVHPYVGESEPADVLLRNDWTPDGRRWVDATARAGLRATGYGMSVTTGDLDGDGWTDLFIGNYGADQLWRNRGDGTFEDVTLLLPGGGGDAWTTGGVFVDYDGDGDEDLYSLSYVEYSVAEAPDCYAASTMRDYCGPSAFDGTADVMYRNEGGGRLTDVSAQLGLDRVRLAGLGVAVLDADGDGTLELFVANDGQPNNLWTWRGGEWVDDALLAGVAVNVRGEPEASMGVAVGDYDRDRDEDLLVTHLDGETNTLYANQGNGLFDDLSVDSGLGAPSLPHTGFGVVWLDRDHDGWLDVVVANGAVRIQEELAVKGDPYPLSQPSLLFSSHRGTFVPAGALGPEPAVGRGLAAGDVDDDGDRDLLLTANSGTARLFSSPAAGNRNWIGITLRRPAHQRVEVRYADGSGVVARAGTSGSYASAGDPRVVFGGAEPPMSLSVQDANRRRLVIEPPLGRYLRFP